MGCQVLASRSSVVNDSLKIEDESKEKCKLVQEAATKDDYKERRLEYKQMLRSLRSFRARARGRWARERIK